jgi:hypothetical protein
MLKLIAASLAIAVLTAVAAPGTPAHAEIQYAWCAQYAESTVGATNCGFVTRSQCMATISGIGGFCYENPAYPAAGPAPKRAPRR